MAVVSRIDLENAARDVSDLGKVVNGSATLANPSASAPNNVGTVTTRQNQLIKTLAKLVADGYAAVEARLSPIIYTSTAERTAALEATGVNAIAIGRTCYDKEDTNLYIVVEEMIGDPTPVATKVWHRLSNLDQAAESDLSDVLRGISDVARLSIADHKLWHDREKLFSKNALTETHVQFPGKSVLDEGLARILNYSTWPAAHFGQKGVDYGHRIPDEDLINASTIPVGEMPEWLAATNRIMMRNNNPNILEGYYIPGYVEINGGYERTVWIRDCKIDGNYGVYQAVGKNNYEQFPCYVEYCTMRRFLNESCAFNKGHVAFCDIELSRADGIKASGSDVHIHGNMFRLLGKDLPSTHADGLQVWDCSRLYITGNTFWMPGTGTAFDEGTYGSTQILRLVTESSSGVLEEVYAVGNILGGAGFTVALKARHAGALVQNVVIANNVVAGKVDGDKIWLYGPITKDHWLENNPGTIRNVIFHNNRMSDGTNFATEVPPTPQAGTDQNGLWHYDKTYASPEFMELGKRFGYLDWNGDVKSGVTNRTTG